MPKTKVQWDKDFYDSRASAISTEIGDWKKVLILSPVLGITFTVVLYLIIAAIDWYDSSHPDTDGPIEIVFDAPFLDYLFNNPPLDFWLIVSIFFFGFTYLVPSVWLINRYPHTGWRRLAIVISGVLTPICFIIMVINEGDFFDIDTIIFAFFSCLIFPSIYWAICGARSTIIWIRSGFKN